MLGIEVDDPPHRSDIEKYGIAGELLTAHRVPSACHADRLAFRARGRQRRPQRRLRIDGDDTINARGIELGMDIITRTLDSARRGANGRRASPTVACAMARSALRRVGIWAPSGDSITNAARPLPQDQF
jgi:hypothetical protein